MVPAPPQEKTRPRAGLGVVFSTVLLDLLGFGMLLPLLPFYSKEFGASDSQVIFLFASYSLAQFVCAPLWGRLSDRIGRRPVMLVSIAGDVFAYLLLAWAQTYSLILLARILSGVAAANFSIGQAWIADQTSGQERSRALGLLGAAFGLGFVIGPAVGGIVGNLFGNTAVPLLAAGLAALNFVYAWFRFDESRPAEASVTGESWFSLRSLKDAVAAPKVGALLGLLWLATFAFANLESTLALFCANRFGFDVRSTAYLLTFVGLVNASIQGGALGPLVRRYGERPLAVVGLWVAGAGLAASAFATNLPILIVAMGLTALGVGLHNPTLYGLISRATAEDRQGSVLGVARGLSALARGVGPLTGEFFFTRFGETSPFSFGALTMAGAGILAMTYFFRHRDP